MRLIDATPEVCWLYLYDHLDDLHMIAAQNAIDDMPTVDAVPVVRCKDCYRHEDEEPGMVWCPYVVGSWVPNNWYCADGKRKGGADGGVSD